MLKFILAASAAVFILILAEFVFPGIKTYFRKSRTAFRLSLLPKNEYIVVNGFKVEYQGKMISVDYAVVSRFGIFVIQEKPWGGRIFGKTGDELWVRTAMGKEHRFRNPLSRSRTQLMALREFLGYDSRVFIPVIVFSGGGEAWVNTSVDIIPGFRLRRAILDHTEERMDYMQVQDAAIRLGEL